MNRFKTGSIAIVIMLFTGNLLCNAQNINHINSQEFFDQYDYFLTSDSVRIIDGRTDTMFYAQHIAGAINIDVDLCDAKELLRQETTTPVVVIYCTTNRRSYDILEILSSFYTGDIYIISDGLRGWIDNQLPVVSLTNPACK